MLLRFSLIIRTLKSSATRPNYRIAKPIGLSSSLAFHLLFNIFLVRKLANPMLSLVVPIIFRTTKITKTVFFSHLTSSPLCNASRFTLITLNSSNGSKTPNSLIPKFSTSYGISSPPNHQLPVPRFVDNGQSKTDLYSVRVVSISPRMTPSAVISFNCSTILPPLDIQVAIRHTTLFSVTCSSLGWAGLYSTTLMVVLFVNRQKINQIVLPFPCFPSSRQKMPPRSRPLLWTSLSLFPHPKDSMPSPFLSIMMLLRWLSLSRVIRISPLKARPTCIVTMSGNVLAFLLSSLRIADPNSLPPSLVPSVTLSVSPRPCPPRIILKQMAKPSVLIKV